MNQVRVFSDPLFLEHETGQHPENPRRLAAIHERLTELSGDFHWQSGEIQAAAEDWLSQVHAQTYLDVLKTINSQNGGRLDPDTVMSERSLDVAIHAAGTACAAVRCVIDGHADQALVLSRPPGHHARPHQAMGFCLLNNVAVAARYAQSECQLQRLLIIDWDVHHGNGTQEIFYDDGNVVYFSIHRSPFYPGTGDSDETGQGRGLGATFNIPVHYGVSRQKFRDLFQSGLDQALRVARPELILISAGFDAHRLDPIGSLGLETEDFGILTDLVMTAAQTECQGRIVSLLEGGYHPDALADAVALHLRRLCLAD